MFRIHSSAQREDHLPIRGSFDLQHLSALSKQIFQQEYRNAILAPILMLRKNMNVAIENWRSFANWRNSGDNHIEYRSR